MLDRSIACKVKDMAKEDLVGVGTVVVWGVSMHSSCRLVYMYLLWDFS